MASQKTTIMTTKKTSNADKVNIENITSASTYAMPQDKSKGIDCALKKVWNRKIIKQMETAGRSSNMDYAEKYATTLERLKRKLEEKKNKN
jgi:hypothetical protein